MVTSLQCFMDADRSCGPDCMAYSLKLPDGEDYQGECQWGHCQLLLAAHRVSKHVVILTNVVDGAAKKWKALTADQARLSSPSRIG